MDDLASALLVLLLLAAVIPFGWWLNPAWTVLQLLGHLLLSSANDQGMHREGKYG